MTGDSGSRSIATRRGPGARLARGSLAVLVIIAIVLLLLEGGVRLTADLFGLTPYMRYDPDIGWTTRPGAHKRHVDRAGQFDVTYDINAHGFRGRDYPVARTKGQYRILLLGDSTGFGWGVPQEQTLAGILDDELPDTEVINLSLSGFGIDQSYLRFIKEGVAFKPDLVIVQISHNDFEEIMQGFFNQKAKPQFVLSNSGELILTNTPVRARGEAAREFYRNSLPVPAKEWLGWHSYSFNLLNGMYYGMRRSSRTPAGRAPSIYTAESVALFNAIIRALEERIRAIGARGLVVHAVKDISEQSLIRTREMPVVDLYRAFRSGGGARVGDFYFSDGYHWNSKGHRVAAEEIERVLSAPPNKH